VETKHCTNKTERKN